MQAQALMEEKARVAAENCALQRERADLLERLEYMEQVLGGAGQGRAGGVGLVQCDAVHGAALSCWLGRES